MRLIALLTPLPPRAIAAVNGWEPLVVSVIVSVEPLAVTCSGELPFAVVNAAARPAAIDSSGWVGAAPVAVYVYACPLTVSVQVSPDCQTGVTVPTRSMTAVV